MAYQTNALDFLLRDGLQGLERNPEFSTNPRSDKYVAPDAETNMYVFEQDELGILDLALAPIVPQTGVRFISKLWIWAPNPPADMGKIELVDAKTLEVMRLVHTTTEAQTFIQGIKVPHAAALRFSGWESDLPHRVRLRVQVAPAADQLNWAQLTNAFCCLDKRAEIAPPKGSIPVIFDFGLDFPDISTP